MSWNTAHLVETALLFLAAYLLGCVLGYGVRRMLHAARGTRQVTSIAVPAVVETVPEIRRVRSPAARLAATVDEPMPKPAEVPVIASKPAPAKIPARAKSADARPLPLLAPRDGKADNLKQIKGIGPKIEASLNGLGIYHLDQIASWNKAQVDWVESQLAFKGRIRRERWVEQATEMARTAA